MRLTCLVVAFVSLTGLAFGQTLPATASVQIDQQKLLAADSLVNSARGLFVSPTETVARDGRIVAQARFAQRLIPSDTRSLGLIADVMESQGKFKEASEAMEASLKLNTQDLSLRRRWLDISLKSRENDDQRVLFLSSVDKQKNLPKEIRAEAIFQLAHIFESLDNKEAMKKAVIYAAELDPHHPKAGEVKLALEGSSSPDRMVELLLYRLQSSPLAIDVPWMIAEILNSLGLHSEAAVMYDHVWALHKNAGLLRYVDPVFMVKYFNALFDAGRVDEAVDIFAQEIKSIPHNQDLKMLLIEAYRFLRKDSDAEIYVKMLESTLKSDLSIDKTGQVAAQVAWFYTVVKPQPHEALMYARQAVKASDVPLNRVLGAAELQAGLISEGEPRLRKLMGTDATVAAILAEYYLARRERTKAIEAINAGAAQIQGGPAYRKLRALGVRYGIPIPSKGGSAKVEALIKAFDKRYLEMGRFPEKFVGVTLSLTGESVDVGQPIIVKADLTNKAQIPVPMGQAGLMKPNMKLLVEAIGPSTVKFERIPLVVWVSPRFLQPGQTLTTKVRLDTGELAEFLSERPFDKVHLKVTGIVSPADPNQKLPKSLSSVKLEPLEITRTGLLDRFDRSSPELEAAAYKYTLAYIVRDLRTGDTSLRMAAARTVGSLLRLHERKQRGRVKISKPIDAEFTKPMLLSLMQAVLADKAAVVRAEMIVSLEGIRLDQTMQALLARAMQDPDPLVRLRTAELIGTSKIPNWSGILARMSKDSDILVQQMAATFIEPSGRPAKTRR